jgi:hypothetical protein
MPKQLSILLRQAIERERPHLVALTGEEGHGCRDMDWRGLIDLWYHYNALLAHLVGRIPDDQMGNRCVIGSGVQTLRFVIEDYVLHMKHHLDHVLARDTITPYPS